MALTVGDCRDQNEKEKRKLESEAEAKANSIIIIAKANKELHTPEYIELEHFKSFYNNAKIHTGTKEMLKNSHNLLHTNMGSAYPTHSPTSPPPHYEK